MTTQTARDLVAQGLDALDVELGKPTVSAQLAAKDQQIVTLTGERDAAVTAKASLQTKIDAAKAAAQADKTADAANAAGQGVLDALA